MGCDRIILSAPVLARCPGGIRLVSNVVFPSVGKKELWIEVDEEYGNSLVCDRLDGFLVWVLPYALRNGYSIECEAPVSRRLLYQINHYLAPGLSKFITAFHKIEITAETCSRPVCSECGAATGWTGGVDSLYTLLRTMDIPDEGHKLTHLMVMSCGALEGDDNSELVKKLADDARNGICSDTGLEMVRVDSNIGHLVPEPYLWVSDYRLAGVALCLQGLFSKFYVSSTYDFKTTKFFEDASCYYSLFSLPLLSTETLELLPVGGSFNRMEKIKAIADFPIARKYLHPCIFIRQNCGRCDKCIRTEAALYSIGKLDCFRAVFDVDSFHKNKNWYLTRLLSLKGNQHCAEVIDELSRRGEEIDPEVLRQARILSSARQIVAKNKDAILSRMNEK